MILIRLFLLGFLLFTAAVFALGALAWLKIRLHLNNPLPPSGGSSGHSEGGKVIEGEYKVLNDTFKNK